MREQGRKEGRGGGGLATGHAGRGMYHQTLTAIGRLCQVNITNGQANIAGQQSGVSLEPLLSSLQGMWLGLELSQACSLDSQG